MLYIDPVILTVYHLHEESKDSWESQHEASANHAGTTDGNRSGGDGSGHGSLSSRRNNSGLRDNRRRRVAGGGAGSGDHRDGGGGNRSRVDGNVGRDSSVAGRVRDAVSGRGHRLATGGLLRSGVSSSRLLGNGSLASGFARNRDLSGGLLLTLSGRSSVAGDLVSLGARGSSGHDLESSLALGRLSSLSLLGTVGGGVNDGDSRSRRGSSRRVEGLGSSGLARHNCGEGVSDGGDGNMDLGGVSSSGSGNGTGLGSRADVGALNDGGGDDLLGVAGRAVDDGGRAAGDGVDVGGGDGAGDIAGGLGLSESGRGARASRVGTRSRAGSLSTGRVSLRARGTGNRVGTRARTSSLGTSGSTRFRTGTRDGVSTGARASGLSTGRGT